MTTSVDLPEAVERAIQKKIESGEYSSKSDFIREAVRTHLDKILLTPPNVQKRAQELRQNKVEPLRWEDVQEEV